LGLITDPGKQLQWLNAPYPFENFWQDIETALSFAECEFHTQRGSEKPSPLATRLS
jgi:hypothetical protein